MLGLLPLLAIAEDDDSAVPETSHVEHEALETLVVSALPVARSKLESAQPIDVLFGEKLDDRRGVTLGETLMRQPGVHSTSYGPGAGRPVIRGLGGGRVQVLEDNLPAVDVSAQSDDHAVSIEPMLIDRVEILRGPSTLLFGSGAVGGVVNVVDGRIPEDPPGRGLEGRFELRGNTAASERAGVLRLDGGRGNWAWNVSGSWRDADDYDIPGLPEAGHDQGDGHDHAGEAGTLPNSFVESQSASAGASWFGARGFIGMALKRFETDYGIPAPHAHAADDDAHHHQGDDHDDEHDEDVYVALEHTRVDLKAVGREPLPGFTRATLRTSFSDYTHAERAVADHGGDHAHTVFDVDSFSARLELEHPALAGWGGALGFQFEDESLAAAGEEAYVPDGDTRSLALFALEEKTTGALTWTLGARVERNRIAVDKLLVRPDHDDLPQFDTATRNATRKSFTTLSASAGALWRIDERWQSSLNYAHAQRAPSQSDLFANGAHAATFTFERGAPGLGKETTNGLDFIVHRHDEHFDLEASLFYNRIDDFIHLDETGEFVDGLPLRQTRQGDAIFHGGELEAVWHLPPAAAGHFDLRVGYDWVRAELDSGENLPRISPARYRAGIDWHRGALRAALDYQRVGRARHLAPHESSTPGYDLLDVDLAYFFSAGGAELELFAKLANLLDEEARVHTSFLKDYAPLPGRNVNFGLRGRF